MDEIGPFLALPSVFQAVRSFCRDRSSSGPISTGRLPSSVGRTGRLRTKMLQQELAGYEKHIDLLVRP